MNFYGFCWSTLKFKGEKGRIRDTYVCIDRCRFSQKNDVRQGLIIRIIDKRHAVLHGQQMGFRRKSDLRQWACNNAINYSYIQYLANNSVLLINADKSSTIYVSIVFTVPPFLIDCTATCAYSFCKCFPYRFTSRRDEIT